MLSAWEGVCLILIGMMFSTRISWYIGVLCRYFFLNTDWVGFYMVLSINMTRDFCYVLWRSFETVFENVVRFFVCFFLHFFLHIFANESIFSWIDWKTWWPHKLSFLPSLTGTHNIKCSGLNEAIKSSFRHIYTYFSYPSLTETSSSWRMHVAVNMESSTFVCCRMRPPFRSRSINYAAWRSFVTGIRFCMGNKIITRYSQDRGLLAWEKKNHNCNIFFRYSQYSHIHIFTCCFHKNSSCQENLLFISYEIN